VLGGGRCIVLIFYCSSILPVWLQGFCTIGKKGCADGFQVGCCLTGSSPRSEFSVDLPSVEYPFLLEIISELSQFGL
jgi:hypothetical protein